MQFKLVAICVALVAATAVVATPSPAPAAAMAELHQAFEGKLEARDCNVCHDCPNGSFCCGGCGKPGGCCGTS